MKIKFVFLKGPFIKQVYLLDCGPHLDPVIKLFMKVEWILKLDFMGKLNNVKLHQVP